MRIDENGGFHFETDTYLLIHFLQFHLLHSFSLPSTYSIESDLLPTWTKCCRQTPLPPPCPQLQNPRHRRPNRKRLKKTVPRVCLRSKLIKKKAKRQSRGKLRVSSTSVV